MDGVRNSLFELWASCDLQGIEHVDGSLKPNTKEWTVGHTAVLDMCINAALEDDPEPLNYVLQACKMSRAASAPEVRVDGVLWNVGFEVLREAGLPAKAEGELRKKCIELVKRKAAEPRDCAHPRLGPAEAEAEDDSLIEITNPGGGGS